jgi:type IV pilus assembly protein PilC
VHRVPEEGGLMAADAAGGLLKVRVNNKMHPKATNEDVQAFFQQLSTMFRAGTPIYDAITIAGAQCQSTKLQAVIENVAQRVASGQSLNSSLATYPQYFLIEWIEVIRSGEDSGQLGKVLEKLTVQMIAAQELRGKLVSAMMYPIIILCVAIGAIAVMLVKVVPTFANMFQSMGKELPGITQAVLAVSDFLRESGFTIVLGIAAIIFAYRRWVATAEGRRTRDRLLVSLPLVGDVLVQASMQKFASNVALLLRAGLPLLDAIVSMKGIFSGNKTYQEAMTRVTLQVERGGNLADAMEESGVFTSFVVSMTRIGEGSGTLPDVLDEVEVFYRRKVEIVVGRLTGSLETVVILFMGVTVAVILCAVYLPMFSAASGVS